MSGICSKRWWGTLLRVAREESRRRVFACCYWDVYMLLTSEEWLEGTDRQGPIHASYFSWRVIGVVPINPVLVLQLYPASLAVTDTVNTYIAKPFERLLDIWNSFAPERRAGATAHLIRGGTIERIREIWRREVAEEYETSMRACWLASRGSG